MLFIKQLERALILAFDNVNCMFVDENLPSVTPFFHVFLVYVIMVQQLAQLLQSKTIFCVRFTCSPCPWTGCPWLLQLPHSFLQRLLEISNFAIFPKVLFINWPLDTRLWTV